jgi:Na+-transporting methylmalonyl-CoA/oxaloacetate decarboxylase beta subunit
MSISLADIFLMIWNTSGFAVIGWQELVMIGIACILIYLAIVKQYEPLLLLPIAFGVLLANLPLANLMMGPPDDHSSAGGLLYYLYQGVKLGIYPSLIFLGIGAMTDFGPLIARPSSLFLGAAAQLGIYIAFIIAIMLGFSPPEAASIGIIGGADGPTAIFLTAKLAPELLPAIAIAAYSYMALIILNCSSDKGIWDSWLTMAIIMAAVFSSTPISLNSPADQPVSTVSVLWVIRAFSSGAGTWAVSVSCLSPWNLDLAT